MVGVRIFMHQLVKDDLTEMECQQLIRDFRNYKEGKGLPATFGRDVPTTIPSTGNTFSFSTCTLREVGKDFQ